MRDHPPRHRIEELVTEWSGSDPALRAHVDSCAHCRERVRALTSARAAFHEQCEPGQFARAVLARSSTRKAWSLRTTWTAAALAVAAAVSLLWMRPLRESEVIRFKGGASLHVYVQHAGSLQLLQDGQALAAHDQLAFVYSLAQARYLLLLSIDDQGAVTRYYPAEALSRALAPATRAQLPVGVELDAHRGAERLVALFSEDAIDEARAKASLQAALRDADARGVGVAGMKPLGLSSEQVSVWFRKP